MELRMGVVYEVIARSYKWLRLRRNIYTFVSHRQVLISFLEYLLFHFFQSSTPPTLPFHHINNTNLSITSSQKHVNQRTPATFSPNRLIHRFNPQTSCYTRYISKNGCSRVMCKFIPIFLYNLLYNIDQALLCSACVNKSGSIVLMQQL